MAEPLPTLIKLAEQKVLKVQRDIANTQTSITNLENQRKKLQDELERGGALANASNNVAMLQQSGAFIGRAKKQEEHMAGLRQMLDAQLAKQREELATHHAEQKRYEVLWKREQGRRAHAHAMKVQAQLDEAAGVAEWLNRKPS